MARLSGYIGRSPDDRVRIYRLDDPQRYVDVASDATEIPPGKSDGELLQIDIADEADLQEGVLSAEGFAALFTEHHKPRAYDSFYHTTGRWFCSVSIEIC